MQSTCACLALPHFIPHYLIIGMVGGGVVTARELQYLILVFDTHRGDTRVPSLNIAAVIMIIIPVWIEAVLVLLCHEFKLAFLLRFYRK